MAAAAVAVPEHKLSESPNSRTIDIFDWTITAKTGPISSANRCDALQASLGIPLPEMTFGYNLLQITHRSSGWTYAFRVEDALIGVKNGPLEDGDGGVKVGYAEAWLKSRSVSSQSDLVTSLVMQQHSPTHTLPHRTSADSGIPMPQTLTTKPYDWTYTTTYAGSIDAAGSRNAQWVPGEPTNTQHAIPIAELSRPDPILFYAEVPLFEDELHDNGASHLLVRIVRPSSIFPPEPAHPTGACSA
jgi:type 2A phosphatase activator TIP41